jgi:hypothetical protein
VFLRVFVVFIQFLVRVVPICKLGCDKIGLTFIITVGLSEAKQVRIKVGILICIRSFSCSLRLYYKCFTTIRYAAPSTSIIKSSP